MRKPSIPGPHRPRRWRTLLGMSLFVMMAFAVGLLLGWERSAAQVGAPAPPAALKALKASPLPVPPAPEASPEYAQRVVAYIYGNIPITREELGEYLIARYGADKLELLVNKRIIEKACRDRGIEVSAAEIKAALKKDCAQLGISEDLFLQKVLRERKVTQYEWEEDVLKPQLLLTKLCRDRVQVTEEELRMAFEAHYGEKVEVQIILYPKDETNLRILGKIYEKVRFHEDEFIKAAREQPDPNLAMTAGKIQPINRHSGNPEVEKAAFRLQPGEVSEVIGTPGGYLIMRCLNRIPPDRTKVFENERDRLTQEVIEKKIQIEMRQLFAELRKEADPKLFLKKAETMSDLERTVHQELQTTEPKAGRPATGK